MYDYMIYIVIYIFCIMFLLYVCTIFMIALTYFLYVKQFIYLVHVPRSGLLSYSFRYAVTPCVSVSLGI